MAGGGFLIKLKIYYQIKKRGEIKGENVGGGGGGGGGGEGEGDREKERGGAGRFGSWFPRGLSLSRNRGQRRGTAANSGEILMISPPCATGFGPCGPSAAPCFAPGSG